jgi:hypothetical protein
VILVGDVMRAREKRARRWRYCLRDHAGLAGVERLLAADTADDRLPPNDSGDDASTKRRSTRLRDGLLIGGERKSLIDT